MGKQHSKQSGCGAWLLLVDISLMFEGCLVIAVDSGAPLPAPLVAVEGSVELDASRPLSEVCVRRAELLPPPPRPPRAEKGAEPREERADAG